MGEPSTGPTSYVAQSNYDRLLDDQNKQRAFTSKLEQAYTSLDIEHQKLSEYHANIRRRENKRDKFFNGIWKGVKGLWKVLKPRVKLPSISPKADDDISA